MLNSYITDLTDEGCCKPSTVHFYHHAPGQTPQLKQAEMPGHGTLGPLFRAFGLITEQDLLDGIGKLQPGVQCQPRARKRK